MQFMLLIKGNNKYSVEDKKSRTLYTIKKKGFGNNNRLVLLDASNYHLYTLITSSVDSLSYSVILNDDIFMRINCKSKFLDPTIECKNNDISYRLVSKNSRDFTIMDGEEQKGIIETSISASGELQYDLDINDKIFDDYIPLFAVVIDKIFGDANRQPKVMEQIAKEKRQKNKE
ncbi:MAG: hypothetical protein K2K66_03665 [Ruminococcus sp.]|nr:hypothetical protein [Ruminococcus sp.]MDE6539265.1 hypothetical protein [Ruminococcus sp.]